MNDRNRITGQSGRSHPVALAFTAIAVGVIVLTGSWNMRTQAEASSGISAGPAAKAEAPTVYFPAQYVNQGRELDPETPTF